VIRHGEHVPLFGAPAKAAASSLDGQQRPVRSSQLVARVRTVYSTVLALQRRFEPDGLRTLSLTRGVL